MLFALCLVFAARSLEFRTSRNDLVSADEAYQRNWLQLKQEFQVQEDLVTLIESDDLEKNRQFVERLAARLEGETSLFRDIFFKGDLRTMGPKALLFLPQERLEQVRRAVLDYGPLVSKFSEVNNLSSLFAEVNAQIRAVKPEQVSGQPLTKSLPALTRIADQATASLERPGVPPSPGVTALFAGSRKTEAGEYVSFAGGRFYVLTCAVREEVLEEAALLRLRELVREIQMEVPGVNVGVTGESVLRFDEMEQAQADTILASVVSLVIVALIFIVGYREIGRPLQATVCLVIGIGYTMGFATLTVGHLNLLTITFVPILIGLAIDFGVHLITRFEEELGRGRPERIALEKALVATGTGICTSGFTIAGAFLAMTLTGFKGIREMGIIAGGGLLVCLIPMMTMLPAMLLSRQEGGCSARPPGKARRRRERIEQLWLKRPRAAVAVGLALTLVAFAGLQRVPFDYNLLNLQSQRLSAVVCEKKLIASAPRSLLSCAVVADSLPEALALEKRIRRLRSVAEVDSVAPLIAENEQTKLDLVRQIKAEAAAIRFAPMDRQPLDPVALNRTLELFEETLRGAAYVLNNQRQDELRDEVQLVKESVAKLRARLASPAGEPSAAKLTLFQQALFRDLESTMTALKNQDYREPLRPQDLPAGLRSRFIGRTGKYLLQVYPRGDVWERSNQERFVLDLRTVDPDVTGSPVQFYEYTNMLKRNFQKSAAYALAAIVIMLMLHFRNAAGVLLILMPVVVGTCWMVGLMAVFHVPFNPANLISLTLLIGIGVANGIHILNRFTEERHPTILAKSTGKAVLVSALTTIAGFGSLMLAKHRGIASLGQVMSIGTATCMLAALTVLPAVLILLTRSGWKLAHGWFAHRTTGEKEPPH
ncbi:MAG TPA: MMPL family transporter [Verrucomicrobiae bacterium]|nr:MMPL family transporter [Verrucomicrobiae bacterium]